MVASTYSSNQGGMEERKKKSRTSVPSVTTPVSSVTRDSSSILMGTGVNIISVEMSHTKRPNQITPAFLVQAVLLTTPSFGG